MDAPKTKLAPPAWACALLGWMLVTATAELAWPHRDRVRAVPTLELGLPVRSERPPSPRELRGIEGIGAVRALQLARALETHGGPISSFDPARPAGDRADHGGPLARRASRGRARGRRLGRSPTMTSSPPHRVGSSRGSAPGLPAPRRGTPDPPRPERIDRVLHVAFEEDRGPGDLTSEGSVPAGARARAELRAKAEGVLAGLPVFVRAFELCDPGARIELLARDGEWVEPGQRLAQLEGEARALLLAERTALNLIQRMSGIATRTARMVRLAGPSLRVLDTRKTTPGLRELERYAVRCGGGENHRFGLFDEVLLKENHIALAGRPIEEVVASLRQDIGPDVRLTAEARDGREAEAAVRGGADVVLLDNMSPEEMARLAPQLRRLADERGRPLELEASGGVTEASLPEIARAGVERVSIGALTHSVTALDLSLYLEPVA